MRFEVEVNTIPYGANGKVNPILHWDSGRNGPPYKKLFVRMVFPPDATPFPGIGELCSNHFTKTAPLCLLYFSVLSLIYFRF